MFIENRFFKYNPPPFHLICSSLRKLLSPQYTDKVNYPQQSGVCRDMSEFKNTKSPNSKCIFISITVQILLLAQTALAVNDATYFDLLLT